MEMEMEMEKQGTLLYSVRGQEWLGEFTLCLV